MKLKTLILFYSISMILLIPLVVDLFVSYQYGSALIILFLMAFATWGILKLRKGKKM